MSLSSFPYSNGCGGKLLEYFFQKRFLMQMPQICSLTLSFCSDLKSSSEARRGGGEELELLGLLPAQAQ